MIRNTRGLGLTLSRDGFKEILGHSAPQNSDLQYKPWVKFRQMISQDVTFPGDNACFLKIVYAFRLVLQGYQL